MGHTKTVVKLFRPTVAKLVRPTHVQPTPEQEERAREWRMTEGPGPRDQEAFEAMVRRVEAIMAGAAAERHAEFAAPATF